MNYRLTLWPCGLMDKVSVSDTGDCRFESCQGRVVLLSETSHSFYEVKVTQGIDTTTVSTHRASPHFVSRQPRTLSPEGWPDTESKENCRPGCHSRAPRRLEWLSDTKDNVFEVWPNAKRAVYCVPIDYRIVSEMGDVKEPV